MAHDRAGRIEDALNQLVDAFVPQAPGEDEESLEDRREEATDRAKDILRSYRTPKSAHDITEAIEGLKKRFVSQGASSEELIRLSNLVSRLLTKQVLSNKAQILDLFLELSPVPAVRESEPEPYQRERGDRSSFSADRRNLRSRDGAPSEAFSMRSVLSRQEKRQSTPNSIHRESRQVSEEPPPPMKDFLNGTSSADGKPSEASLLQDLPYMLQGISSDTLPFSAGPSIEFRPNLPVPIISLLHSLAEPSLLYQSLSSFAKSNQDGSVLQSLQAAIGREIQSYLGLVTTLDSEIRRALATIEQEDSRRALGKTGVTLKRCVYWMREATMGLRLMSLIVEESKGKKGGQLISVVHGYSQSNGDPFIRNFAERLLSHITRPFYEMLRQWIYDGELTDPFLEFFVTEQSIENQADAEGARNRTAGASVWEDKYSLDESLMPSIMTPSFAKKVFLIGKSLNFIRYGCGDSDWVESYSKSASTELRYGDTASLESSIGTAYETTMAQLIGLMETKFHLSTHLSALKKFLLLGQGDFIALLMESLSSSLDRPTNTLYRHNLTAQLEHAIRGSNAQFSPPEVLRRLDARMLEATHGDVGWDAFTLEYKISPPLDVVVSPWGAKQYLKVFNFLWRVKRVEFALGTTWRRCMTGARGVLVPLNHHKSSLAKLWKQARAVIAEMIHFVAQLQYYILFEVIEASWDQLQASIKKPGCTLDDLIDAHTKYLRAITHKGLLGGSGASTSSQSAQQQGFLSQLHGILKGMLAYRDVVDGLYSFSVAELASSSSSSAHPSSPTSSPPAAGLGSPLLKEPFTDGESSGGVDAPLKQRLQHLAADFKGRLNMLLGDLAHQPDVDMRFLGVVMNFNDVYEPVRRRRRGVVGERKAGLEGAKTPATASGSTATGSTRR